MFIRELVSQYGTNIKVWCGHISYPAFVVLNEIPGDFKQPHFRCKYEEDNKEFTLVDCLNDYQKV